MLYCRVAQIFTRYSLILHRTLYYWSTATTTATASTANNKQNSGTNINSASIMLAFERCPSPPLVIPYRPGLCRLVNSNPSRPTVRAKAPLVPSKNTLLIVEFYSPLLTPSLPPHRRHRRHRHHRSAGLNDYLRRMMTLETGQGACKRTGPAR